MAKWLVSLRGDPKDIQALRSVGVPEWQIVEENGVYHLESSDFDGLGDAGCVLHRARELMQVADTAASVCCSSYRSVVVSGGVIRIKDDGTRWTTAFSEDMTFTTRSLEPVALPAVEVREVVALAGKDRRVAEVLGRSVERL